MVTGRGSEHQKDSKGSVKHFPENAFLIITLIGGELINQRNFLTSFGAALPKKKKGESPQRRQSTTDIF